MSEIDSGGNAFPAQVGFYSVPLDHINCDCVKRIGERSLPGLTKRQWFAGMALQGFLSRGLDGVAVERIASDSFLMADAMVQAGKGEKNGE